MVEPPQKAVEKASKTFQSSVPDIKDIPISPPSMPEVELGDEIKKALNLSSIQEIAREVESLAPSPESLRASLSGSEFSAEGLRKLAKGLGLPRSGLYGESGRILKKEQLAERLHSTLTPKTLSQ